MTVCEGAAADGRMCVRRAVREHQRPEQGIVAWCNYSDSLHLTQQVQCLQQRNVGVVIRDEHDFNVVRISNAMEKENAKAMSKGKEKVSYASKGQGKENACPAVPNGYVISRAILAQRARRERERNENACFAYQSGQRLRQEQERLGAYVKDFPSLTPSRRSHACLEQGTKTLANTSLAQKQTMVTHASTCSFSMESTSLARNW
ncbi:hypothetical protein TEA_010813 [Camellia sinensis var. sinensis]|uniref:Uncharacterized protein n=1 Tax=Camellia sinensis var. sinensis TaxID=542762 RepID=A0A4V6RY14_CAMSN|nr:hypothetical protein TEA_010813 [Camellia sinensis var. sinensis]